MRAVRLRLRLSFTCAVAVLLGPSIAALPTPDITALVNLVTATNTTEAVDCYADYLLRLQTREGDTRGYSRSRAAQPDLLETRSFIRSALQEQLGAAFVVEQSFDASGYAGVNIVGTLPGEGPSPQGVYVIGAHYDSEQNPGADDDASGVAALLEAARVLRKSRFKDTIVFVAFDQEEERRNGWGRGSQFYAEQAKKSGMNMRAMVGLDMVAYNHAGGNRATLSRCDRAQSSTHAQLSAKVRTAFLDYSGLAAVTTLTGEDASDPYLFYKAGYPALLISEEFDEDGWPFNPNYHRSTDFYLNEDDEPLEYAGNLYIDLPYAARIVRGVVGWAATEAGHLGRRGTLTETRH
jgi:hypothetical protein